MAKFNNDFWRDLSKLGIYSTEADDDSPTLADQMDASVAGGANSTDTEEEAPEGDDSGLDDDIGSDDMGGNADMEGGDMGEGGDAGANDAGGDMGGGASSEDPNENPFKGQNGKAFLDDKLAELQTAITDTLERIYANPKVEQVVVSELENLQDSVRNIRETVFLVPVDATLYKYQLSTLSYKNLSELICSSLKVK